MLVYSDTSDSGLKLWSWHFSFQFQLHINVLKFSLIKFVIINKYTKHQTYSMYVEDMMCMFRQKCISTTRSRKLAKLYDQKSCNTNKDLYWPFVEMTLFRPISNVTMF